MFFFVMKSGEIKKSPFSTETDNFYCLETSGSQWPAAVGLQGLAGSKNDQFLHWRDLLSSYVSMYEYPYVLYVYVYI